MIRTLKRLLMIAALALLIFYLAVYVVYANNLIQFPFDYDQGEGFELVDTILFSRGEFPYKDTNVYPFYSSNYPPLYHVILVPFVWLFGEGYWYGRLAGFVATLIAAGAIAYAVNREGKHRMAAVLSGLAFLASNTVYHIGPLFRQHMTMVMFETLAVVILANVNEIEDQGKRRRVLMTGLAFVLAAGYTKQLAVATAAAVFVFLFIRQPRRAVVSGIVFALIGGAIFLWMNIATNGQWWLQTITANVNPFHPEQTVALFQLWFGLHGFLIVPAVLYLLYELYFTRVSIFAIWFVAGVAVAVLSGKWGAGDSYFATSIAALCILSGLFAAKTLRREWVNFRINLYTRLFVLPLWRVANRIAGVGVLIIPLLYLGYGRAVLHMPTEGAVFSTIADVFDLQATAHGTFYDSAYRFVGGYADIGHLTTQADIDAGWRIVDILRSTDKPVLSEEAAFNLLAGKEVITNPTQLLNLAQQGIFDSSGLIGMIERQEFGYVVMRAQFYPMDVLQTIAVYYDVIERVAMNGFEYIIFEPRPEPLIAQHHR
ncbi:MAG: hypothetical protein IAE80_08015 [Anaerolinea sp.]|nr:hypothetical protein [Anaerolinea sp.]